MFSPSMSEFKYACPVCGQHIKCDSSQAGSVMECPTCFQKITVPQAPATDDPKYIITGTKTGERPVAAAMANSARTPPPAKSSPVAAIAFVVLIGAAIAAVLVFRDKIFKPKPAPAAAAVEDSSNKPDDFKSVTPANGAVNIALNKPSFAGSQESKHPAKDGNDGDPRTRWCAASGSVPQWWEVDLGMAATITNAQVIWEHDGVYQYKIQTSFNHKDWATVIDKTGNSTPAQVNSDNFSADGRYVRITVTGLQSGSWASFYEFQALGFGG
jgi:DNA-directed RNA polymerase subunit RPC12/RpoP